MFWKTEVERGGLFGFFFDGFSGFYLVMKLY